MTDPAVDQPATTPPADTDETADLDAIREEVAAEQPEAAAGQRPPGRKGDPVTVPLRGIDLSVLHPIDWPGSATEFYIQGRHYSWAMKTMATADSRAQWDRIDPPAPEAIEFIDAVFKKLGANPQDFSVSQMWSGAMRAG